MKSLTTFQQAAREKVITRLSNQFSDDWNEEYDIPFVDLFLQDILLNLVEELEKSVVEEGITYYLMQDGVSNDFGYVEGWNKYRETIIKKFREYKGV